MNIKDFKNKTVKALLIKMCEMVNCDVNTIDFSKQNWYWDYSWNEKQEGAYREWMLTYLLKDKKRIGDIAKFPSLAKKSRKELEAVVDHWLMNYGWKTNDY